MGAAENAAVARAEMDAYQRGDIAGVLDLYTDDVVLHYPGRNVLSGTYTGKDAVRGWIMATREKVGLGTTVQRTLHDVVASNDHAIQLVSVDTSANGKSAHWNAALVMHVRDGKISEIWIHIDDPYAVDDLLLAPGDRPPVRNPGDDPIVIRGDFDAPLG